jgi:hypothetical protein
MLLFSTWQYFKNLYTINFFFSMTILQQQALHHNFSRETLHSFAESALFVQSLLYCDTDIENGQLYSSIKGLAFLAVETQVLMPRLGDMA